MRVLLTAVFACLSLLLPAQADDTPRPDERALFDALHLPEMIAVMAQEGRADALGLAQSFFPGRVGTAWADEVAEIYDVARMEAAVVRAWSGQLAPAEVAVLRAYFEADFGADVLARELAARRGMTDPAIDAAAIEFATELPQTDPDRLARLNRLIAAYDLVEGNVAAALNANYAFFRGLSDGGALPTGMSDGDIITQVWSQEGAVRAGAEEWLYAYLGLSYAGLSDAELDRYITFAETPEARALNRLLFDSFGPMFEALNYRLALAVARQINAEDI